MAGYYNDSVKRLFKIITELKTEEECRMLFEDLCTIKEILDLAQRIDVALLLDDKENNSYQSISAKIGVSSATISRVNRCLNYGTGG